MATIKYFLYKSLYGNHLNISFINHYMVTIKYILYKSYDNHYKYPMMETIIPQMCLFNVLHNI